MSTSAIGSTNPYSYLQWPQTSGTTSTDSTSSTDTSGAPSDPLLALFNSATGGSSTGDPLLDSLGDGSSQGPTSPFSPETMSALFSAQGQQSDPTTSGTSGQSLFAQFDANGDGSISQTEFEQAIGPNADKSKVDQLFNALDGNGDGSISQNEMSSATQKAHGGGHHHHHHAGGAGGAGQSQATDPLSQLLSGTTTQADGSTSQSVTNADGSTSTTLTYADGTTITMSTPATPTSTDSSSSSSPADNSSSDSSSSNTTASSLQAMLEKMINAQAQMFAPPSAMDVSI